MSASNSPYLHPEDDLNTSLEQALRPLSSTIAPSTLSTLEDSSMFGPSIYSTPITYTSYDSDFQSLFHPSTDVCGSESVHLPPFQSHQLPTYWTTSISEASDYSETLTPISLRPPIDLKGSPPPPPVARHFSPVAPQIQFPSPIRPRSTLINPPTTPISPTTPKRRASFFGVPVQPLSPRTPEPRRFSRDGLGIEGSYQPTPMASPKPHRTPSSGDQIPPPPRRLYANIAPNPVGMRQLQPGKRALSVDEENDSASKKRKLSISSSPPGPIEINEEDSFLLRLKDDELLSWKDISSRFQTDLGKTVQIPALQMRLKRLRERLMVWRDPDVTALRMAHDFWIASKFEIIASKMADYGALSQWNARQCSRKWNEIGFSSQDTPQTQFGRTPTFSASYTSSPIEKSPHHGFYPFVSAS